MEMTQFYVMILKISLNLLGLIWLQRVKLKAAFLYNALHQWLFRLNYKNKISVIVTLSSFVRIRKTKSQSL